MKVTEQREKIVKAITEISVTQHYIKEQIDKIEKHLDILNGRVGRSESRISWLMGISSLFATLITALFITYN
ncbi:MAG: hypothetical protein Unbinned4311contig1001_12 [Prokaryotic dsDNA virus sp.]|nr:MAG: hypothetical protein Unbinned4311contig1001_12 [Prokaryotic dsDNA virus sp.]|tara:strand:+ start:558 stop:773 length:216 start_codon:yes stop_codon:yes gene_type:complete